MGQLCNDPKQRSLILPFDLLKPSTAIREVSNYQLAELVKSITVQGLKYEIPIIVVPDWAKEEDQLEFEKTQEDEEALKFLKEKNIKCSILAGNHRFGVNI